MDDLNEWRLVFISENYLENHNEEKRTMDVRREREKAVGRK